MKPLAIRQLSLTQFKNYTEAEFSFGDRFNLISGLNGVGKTNLLDAVYYICVGKSYFTPFDQRNATTGESFFRITGQVLRDQVQHDVIVKVKPGQSKELTVDGLPVEKVSQHLGFIPIVFSAPRDLELVMGTGHYRRRYFDHLLCQIDPDYVKALMEYNYLLQLRMAALKNGFEDLRRVIQSYDEKMAPLAQMIFTKRSQLAREFTSLLEKYYALISGRSEGVGFLYESTLQAYPYAVLVDKHWELDRSTMRSNVGIHKDDYALSIKKMSAKEYASQGQIKSFIFALHLTKFTILSKQVGFKPLLVLDDIFDKLDEHRLSRLMEILDTDDFGQVFISDTSGERMSKRLSVHEVKEIILG